MHCVWDEKKNRINIRHGISFELASRVFDDPHHTTSEDYLDDNSEMRYQTFGLVGGAVLIMVAHIFREESGEEYAYLISARKAVAYEENDYWSQHRS